MIVRLMVLALLLTAAPAGLGGQASDERDAPRFQATAWAGASVREGQTTLRFARDMRSVGGRLTLYRVLASRPWIQTDWFWRPGLECEPSFSCTEEGLLLRAGFVLPLSDDEPRPGFHPYLVGGAGAAFAEETALTYLFGLGGAWIVHPRLAPSLEVRWERVPGLRNVIVLAAGLRIGVL